MFTVSTVDFKTWIQNMELVVLEMNDRKFTWFRDQSCSYFDRVLVSVGWIEEFSEMMLKGR
ncbi:hypothetical protein AHAS_Ahas02G0039700 [Arachis hypogaea]